MLIDPIKPNQEQYICRTMEKGTHRMYKTKIQPMIQSSQLCNDEEGEGGINKNANKPIQFKPSKPLPIKSKASISNQIRTNLLLIIDSERVTAMASKCKINSKSITEVMNQLGSYEITIENPLERGTTNLFNAVQFRSFASTSKLPLNKNMRLDNGGGDDDEEEEDNDAKNDYLGIVNRIKKKRTISTRKLKKELGKDIAMLSEFNSLSVIESPQSNNNQFDLMVKGYEYLRFISLTYKRATKKKAKCNKLSESNIRDFNAYFSSEREFKQRAKSIKEKAILDSDNNLYNTNTNTTANNDCFRERSYSIQTEGNTTANTINTTTHNSTTKKKKIIKYSSFNSQSKLKIKKKKRKEKKTLDEKIRKELISTGSIVISFNGEELAINDVSDLKEIRSEYIDEGVCLLPKHKSSRTIIA